MRFYLRWLMAGELPVLDVGDHPAVTISGGKVVSCKLGVRAWAVEYHFCDYPRYRQPSRDHAFEYDTDLETMWPAVRQQLVDFCRPMRTKSALVFLRRYTLDLTNEILNPTVVSLTAGVIGLDANIAGVWRGPFWDSTLERYIDQTRDGATMPPELHRYGITPRGQIINPLYRAERPAQRPPVERPPVERPA
jgi:hypothetical protein